MNANLSTPRCFKCQTEFKEMSAAQGGMSFRETCEKCGTDAHVCRNCTFYDEHVHHECREVQAEYVRDKERANRCDYFRLNGSSHNQDQKSVFADLDALFKK